MKTSTNGRKFIAKEEGNILYAYDDATNKRVNVGDTVRGTITIGVGHTTAAGSPTVTPGMTITASESDAILAKDLAAVEAQINNLVKVPVNQNQYDALVSFQFNTGGLARSQILRSLNAGDYDGAASAFMNWTKANGNATLLAGRRQREIALFKSKNTATGSATGAAAGAVVAGGTVATQVPHNWVPLILAITLGLTFLTFIVVDYIGFRKQQNVTNVK